MQEWGGKALSHTVCSKHLALYYLGRWKEKNHKFAWLFHTTRVPTKCAPATLWKPVKYLNKVLSKGSSFCFFFLKKGTNKRQQINIRIVLKADESPVSCSQSPSLTDIYYQTCKYHHSSPNTLDTILYFTVYARPRPTWIHTNVWQVLGRRLS